MNTIIILGIILFLVLPIIGIVKIYSQANYPGIVAFIPILNLLFLFPIAGMSAWFFLLLFVPVVDVLLLLLLFYNLSLKFSKGAGFTVGLFFLPFIFFPLLGYTGVYKKNTTVLVN
jgi:hypothetical protein